MPADARALLTIDLDALAANFHTLRAEAGDAEVAPVVKADAYGLGAGPVARRLWREGARSFFVAKLAEGETLRRDLGPERPAAIHVLDGLTDGAAGPMAASALTPVLCTAAQVDAACALADPLPVSLHIDTGMHRQGLDTAEATALARSPGRSRLDIGLVMSHLGSADDPASARNAEQLAAFQAVRALFPQAPASLAASGGTFLGSDYHFDMVRPGVSLYGGGPREVPDPRIAAVATLTAPLLDIREAPAGVLVGYGGSVRLERATRLGVVAAGYADGIIRAAKNGARAWVDGRPAPFVIVTMNLIVIDLGEAQAAIGDPVELVGPNALLDNLASACGSVAHECLVRLGQAPRRVYLGAD